MPSHSRQYAGKRRAAHDDHRADASPAEIGPNVEPFAGREHDVRLFFRPLQQAAIDANHRDRRRVVPGQLVDARVRAVQNPQPIGAARHVDRVIGPSIDENMIALEADHLGVHSAAVNELVVIVEGAILQHDRDFEFARRQVERLFLVVADDNRAGEPAIDLRRRRFMRVRMVEIQPRAIAQLEFIDKGLAGVDRIHRMAVHQHRHMQAVPMRYGRFGQPVAQTDAYFLARSETHDGAKIGLGQRRQRVLGAFQQGRGVAPDARHLAFEYPRFAWAAGQLHVHVGVEIRRRPVGRDLFHTRAAVHGERREDDDAQTPAATPIQPKSERRVKSIACRMTTPRSGANKHIRRP